MDPQPDEGGIYGWSYRKEGYGVILGELHQEGGWPLTDGTSGPLIAPGKFVLCPWKPKEGIVPIQYRCYKDRKWLALGTEIDWKSDYELQAGWTKP